MLSLDVHGAIMPKTQWTTMLNIKVENKTTLNCRCNIVMLSIKKGIYNAFYRFWQPMTVR